MRKTCHSLHYLALIDSNRSIFSKTARLSRWCRFNNRPWRLSSQEPYIVSFAKQRLEAARLVSKRQYTATGEPFLTLGRSLDNIQAVFAPAQGLAMTLLWVQPLFIEKSRMPWCESCFRRPFQTRTNSSKIKMPNCKYKYCGTIINTDRGLPDTFVDPTHCTKWYCTYYTCSQCRSSVVSRSQTY